MRSEEMAFQYEVIDHVQLAAPIGEENTARDCYHCLLGFKEMMKPESLRKRGGVWFQAGDVHIHIGVESSFVPANKAHPAIRIKGLDAFIDHLKRNSLPFTVDNNLPGANRLYLADPFGNRLEFLEWIDHARCEHV